MSTDDDNSFPEIRQARERFMRLADAIRPDLHRYCARMAGSVADGEDIVQDTLARAYFMLAELPAMPQLRPWLFRVAHRRAIDLLRRYDRRMNEALDADAHAVADDVPEADEDLARREAVVAALGRFVDLPPVPRSCVILKDVLGASLEEIADLLELSLPAVKAALHRGRTRLRESPHVAVPEPRAVSPAIARYIALFNARDWDGVRAMLADDVRLDVVSRAQRRGAREVGQYVNNYAGVHDWTLHAAWQNGREVIAVTKDGAVAYFIEVGFDGDRVATIRDFRYVPYIATDAGVRLAE